jgi:hypothetical protein
MEIDGFCLTNINGVYLICNAFMVKLIGERNTII